MRSPITQLFLYSKIVKTVIIKNTIHNIVAGLIIQGVGRNVSDSLTNTLLAATNGLPFILQ